MRKLNPFCWQKIGWGHRKRVWLDCRFLYSVVSIEKRPRDWRRFFRIYTHKYRRGTLCYIMFDFGLLKRCVLFEYIRGGVCDDDIARMKKEAKREIAWAKTLLDTDHCHACSLRKAKEGLRYEQTTSKFQP